MKKLEKKIFATAFSIIALNYIIVANAHDITNVTMDPEGINAGFLGYAQFSCFDDGNGLPDSLIIAIKDLSPPIFDCNSSKSCCESLSILFSISFFDDMQIQL